MSVFSVGTMCVHTGCPITLALCIPNRGSFVPNSKAQKGWSLIKSHWGQYSQLVQGWCHSITHPTGSSLRYTADWLPQQESCGRQGGVGTGQAWRAFFSHWLKRVHQDPDNPTDLFKSLSEPTLFFFFFTKRKPRKFPQAMELFHQLTLTCHGTWKGQDSKIPCISRSGLNNPLLQVAILCIIGNSVAPTRCREQSPQSWQYKMSLDVVNVP